MLHISFTSCCWYIALRKLVPIQPVASSGAGAKENMELTASDLNWTYFYSNWKKIGKSSFLLRKCPDGVNANNVVYIFPKYFIRAKNNIKNPFLCWNFTFHKINKNLNWVAWCSWILCRILNGQTYRQYIVFKHTSFVRMIRIVRLW